MELIKKSFIKNSLFNGEKVDIIIPYHGQYEKLRKLISGIMYSLKSNKYQITLVDDASPNKDFGNQLKIIDPILKVIRSEKQLGFGGAFNLGINNTSQPWIVGLNSDCLIEQSNWLLEMGRSLIALSNSKVRMVSSRNNLTYDGCPDLIKSEMSDFVGDHILEDGFLPMFSFMCPRSLFKEIGLIKEYQYGGYEDEEFAARLRHYGYKQAISGKSWIFHEGGATFSSLLKKKPEIQDQINKNRILCINDIKSLIN
jgi:GT2 family glycosyltransferase